jgi:sugar (pentulose or hexulose) kinase
MGEPLFLGVDLGTTQIKVGAYDRGGAEHGYATARVDPLPSTESGCSEMAAEAWWRTARQVIRDCLRQVAESDVAGVCVGGQGPSLVALDAAGAEICPAILYDDTRAMVEAAVASERLGLPISVRNSYLPRALWLRDHKPVTYASVRWFLQAWDLVVYRLTGVAAATSPLGPYTPWHVEQLEVVGLDPERFPPLLKTGDVVATVTRQAEGETGLLAGTPVVAGGGDFLLGTMGAAGARKGIAQSQGGATGAFTLCWDRCLEGEMIGWCIPSPVRPELVNVGGPLTTGGAALDWLLRSVVQSYGEYEAVIAQAAQVAAGTEGLFFFPYLAGETLIGRPEARGLFIGLSLNHDAGHLVRAVLEGVAFAGRRIMESIVAAGGRVDHVVTYGGQARSAPWNQIKANVWNRIVRTPAMIDAGCLGAAAIAAVGGGAYASLADASEAMAEDGSCYSPDPEQTAVYDAAYLVYREIYTHVRELFVQIGRLPGTGGER